MNKPSSELSKTRKICFDCKFGSTPESSIFNFRYSIKSSRQLEVSKAYDYGVFGNQTQARRMDGESTELTNLKLILNQAIA